MGHEVTVICGLFDIGGLEPLPWYQLFRRERMEGFDVVVCNIRYSNKQGFLRRLWCYFGFAFIAGIVGLLTVRKPDVVFATHAPLMVGISGWMMSRWRLARKPFVFEVRDLWPESDVISGNIREGSFAERGLSWLEKFCYARADKILLVSKGFEDRLLERGYPQAKLKTILLGADGDIFRELSASATFRQANGLEGKTVAIYSGVHGKANGLDYILDAAEILKQNTDIVFLLLGDGMEKPRLIERASQLGLSNVVFKEYVKKTELPGILACCDIGLMILADVGERPVTPNKIFDYMFAGLPSVVNFPGPTWEMVRSDGTGVYVDPKQPQQLVDAILQYASDRSDMKRKGELARKTAFAKYDRRSIARQLAEVFAEVRG